jgi:hypothetical protein
MADKWLVMAFPADVPYSRPSLPIWRLGLRVKMLSCPVLKPFTVFSSRRSQCRSRVSSRLGFHAVGLAQTVSRKKERSGVQSTMGLILSEWEQHDDACCKLWRVVSGRLFAWQSQVIEA